MLLQQVHSGVALDVEHALVREDVVGGRVLAEVEVLDRAVANRLGSHLDVLLWQRRLTRGDALLE